jgi:hypothetical protein
MCTYTTCTWSNEHTQVFTPKWTLVAGGALVGYATDWAALKVMFEPVDPWRPKCGPLSPNRYLRTRDAYGLVHVA